MSFFDAGFLAGGTRAGQMDQLGFQFPDPWLDMASLSMPRSNRDVLKMAEFIWLKNGTYRMAAGRIVRYFITKVEMEGVDKTQKASIDTFLNDRLKVVDQLALLGDDFMAYGNSFSSIVIPFRRILICDKCRSEQPIEAASWEFNDWKFRAYCLRCKSWHAHSHVDRRSNEESKIQVKRWSPFHMEILYHPYSQENKYYWRVPDEIKNEVRKGTKFYIETLPWEIIETIKKDQLFKFNDNVVFHMREDTLAGVRARGWGVSRLLSNFSQAWYTQVLKRFNEALALDYVVPFRVITPSPQRTGHGTADPLLQVNIANFQQKVMGMVREHRRDPASWHSLPFPVEYQALGGEAKDLAMPELIDQGMDDLLNAIGIPAELYRGSLQWQAMPTALRLFQQTWPHLVSNFNGWLEWMMEIVSTAQNWNQPEKVKLTPVTLADDIEKKQIWLQLSAAGIISKRTALGPWGIDPYEEQKKIFDEQREYFDQQQEFEEDMEQRQMTDMAMSMNPQAMGQQGAMPPGGGGMPPGGGGAPMGGGVSGPQPGVTPQDMMAQADGEAQQLLGMPYEMRRKRMLDLKQADPTLHAVVKSRMESIRREANFQGGQMVLQQNFGQGAGA